MGKVRLDFVTNSSASSFIIDKNKFDGELSVEGVFQVLKSLYKEAGELYKEIAHSIAKKYGLTEKGYNCYDEKDERVYIDRFFHEDDDEFYKKYEVELYHLVHSAGSEHELDKYKTYEDYVADGNSSEYRFSICDYRLDSTEITDDTIETIMWYGPNTTPESVMERVMTGILGYKRRKAQLGITSTLFDDFVRKEMLKLGEICICSYEGQMDYFAVQRLAKICSHWCNHMG